jgi:hypothetical protein
MANGVRLTCQLKGATSCLGNELLRKRDLHMSHTLVLRFAAYTIGCSLLGSLSGTAQAAEPAKPATATSALLRAAEGLFDSEDAKTLGLKAINGKHALLYRATDAGYKFCHHPNFVLFNDRLYCMWSNGLVHEDAPGQRILHSSTSDGDSWTDPKVLTDHDQGRGICVAAGFLVVDDLLIAYYTVTGGENFHPETALWARTSRDGRTWSEPRRVTAGFFIEGPRRFGNGPLLFAGEFVGSARKTKRMRLLFTDEAGGLDGWQAIPIAPGRLSDFGYTEPSLYQRPNETVVSTFRNNTGGLFASESDDHGRTWSNPGRTNFPDSTARTSAGNLPDGTAYLINNPLPKQFDRSLLTIALSEDGALFDRAYIIRGEPTKRRYDGRSKLDGWQYPNAIVWKKKLFVAYSINKEDVAVTQIPLEALVAKATRPKSAVHKAKSQLVEQHKLSSGAATQGLALSSEFFFTSTAGSIFRYDTNWKLLQEKPIRIKGVNHVGAIDVHKDMVWAGLLHGPENGKHDPSKDRAIVAKLRAKDLHIVKTWDISQDVTWIDPVCFDGQFLWVGDLSDLGIHRYRFEADRLVRDGVFRYPKEMHFSQGIRVVGSKLYSIHTFGSMDGLFEFDLPSVIGDKIQRPTRVWEIQETHSHLEGFDFVPGKPNQIWHAQGEQVDRYELSGLQE